MQILLVIYDFDGEIMSTVIVNMREHLRFAKCHGENNVVDCHINDLLGVEFLSTVCKFVKLNS